MFCESEVKYKYLACLILTCNRYLVFQEDDEVDEWLAGRRVGYLNGRLVRPLRENFKSGGSGENNFEVKSAQT